MNILASHLAALRSKLENPKDGFVGMTDDVLSMCREYMLRLDWRGDRCRVQASDTDETAEIDIPLRRSGFRLILARVAKLCNDQAAGTLSPYEGAGRLPFETDPKKTLQISWSNTLAAQWLTIVPVAAADPVSPITSCQPVSAPPLRDESSLQQS